MDMTTLLSTCRSFMSNDKRFSRLRWAHCLFLLTFLCLISCVRPPKYNGPYTTVVYEFKGGEDMASLFELTAEYMGPDNQPVKEIIPSLPWRKSIQVPVRFNANLEVSFARKASIPDKESYAIGFAGAINVETDEPNPAPAAANHMATSPENAGFSTFCFTVGVPVGVSPDEINLSIAPLKFNKHIAFTYTVDDTEEGAYARVWRRINKKWMDQIEFFHKGVERTTGYVPLNTLSMGDGCGNERRFGFGVAIWPTLRDDYHPNGRISDASTSIYNIYVTWEELELILDFGGSVYFHNVDETKYDKTNPNQILQGFEDDYQKTYDKLKRRMKVLALADGNESYLTAARQYDKIEFMRNSLSRNLIYLSECDDLYKKETYGGRVAQGVEDKLAELDEQAEAAKPYWVAITSHRVGLDMVRMLETVYEKYGKAGKDNIWAASWDEVYEYTTMREKSQINKSVNGNTVTFEVTVPTPDNYYYKELSFLVSGLGENAVISPASEGIVGMSHARNNDMELVNVNFDPALLGLAEKYVAKYEASSDDEDLEDARYFVNQLLPSLAAPFSARLNEKVQHPISLLSAEFNGDKNTIYQQKLDVKLNVSGDVEEYRIGEKADLAGSEWQSYNSEKINYTLSSGFGAKQVYVQVRNRWNTSRIVSSGKISYQDLPKTGTIEKHAVDLYLQKYDGHKVIINKKLK